jgi:hypothetical protein
MKTLWFLTLLLSPLFVLALTRVGLALTQPLWRAAGRFEHAFVLRSTMIAVAAMVILAGWLPWRIGAGLASPGTWQAASSEGPGFGGSNRSAQRYDIATHYAAVHRRTVVVPYFVGASGMLDTLGTRLVSSLLAFQTGQAPIGGDTASACKAIRIVAGDQAAVVISKLPRDRVLSNMERNGCAGRARVVHVPGGMTDLPPRSV